MNGSHSLAVFLAPTVLFSAKHKAAAAEISAAHSFGNATAKIIQWNPPLYYDGLGSLELVISNAGNAKTGTVYLTVGQ